MSLMELSAAAVGGRRSAKFVLHEIYPDTSHHNANGISWNEAFTRQNMDSVRGMSIKATFQTEDRDVPYDHGIADDYIDGKPHFAAASIVGVARDPEIKYVNVDGRQVLALCCSAELDELTYPNFIGWLEGQVNAGETVSGSVEIMWKAPNKTIIYSGGYKDTGRVPEIYDYIGYSFLSGVEAADKAAVMLELNEELNAVIGRYSGALSKDDIETAIAWRQMGIPEYRIGQYLKRRENDALFDSINPPQRSVANGDYSDLFDSPEPQINQPLSDADRRMLFGEEPAPPKRTLGNVDYSDIF